MKNMKMGKVLTFTTKEDAFGNSDCVITPIPQNARLRWSSIVWDFWVRSRAMKYLLKCRWQSL